MLFVIEVFVIVKGVVYVVASMEVIFAVVIWELSVATHKPPHLDGSGREA